jgi:endonuclease/exonuclease/phosphatase family metal-dependent hydrolase
MEIARLLLHTMDSLQRSHPAALVLAMGDFNASGDEETIRQGFGFAGGEMNAEGFYNLMHHIPQGEGSYKYKDTWTCIDQVIANRKLMVELFAPDFLLVVDEKYMGRKPFRTYTGMNYLGGYSDHLPVMIRIP